MNRLLLFIVVAFLSGCGSIHSRSPVVDSPQNKDVIGDVPLEVVPSIPARIQTLKPGMASEAVLKALGLAGCHFLIVTSGPDQRTAEQLLFRPKWFLILFYHKTRRSPSFIEAKLIHDDSSSMSEPNRLSPTTRGT